EIGGKQVELLKETVPRLSRLAVLGASNSLGTAQNLKEVELAAEAFGVKLQYLDVRDSKDIENAFRAASTERADAVLVLTTSILNSQRKQTTNLGAEGPFPRNFSFPKMGGGWGFWRLGRAFPRFAPPPPYLCEKDPKGGKPRRSAGGTAEKIRVHHQFESGETNRTD